MEARQSAIETYRYLRVGIVGLAALLAVSVVGEIVWGDSGLLGSISAYYYTPVRDIFVGVLMALGLSLIVIRGRGAEDVMLNVAGMLAAVVALVPARPEDAELPPLQVNGIWSMLVIGAIGLVFAYVTASRLSGHARVLALRGVGAGAAGFLGFALWLTIHRSSFEAAAHYVAAALMFGLFVLVARVNATSASDADGAPPVMAMLPAARRRRAYRAISWSMLAGVVVAGLLGLLQAIGLVPIPNWLFWIETALLALFAAFWVLQTVEYWRDGVPLD